MSTRGCVAIGKEEGFCGLYNHFDSYPTGLGQEVWKELQKLKKKRTLDQFPQRLLAFDDWRNYLGGGVCPYCGKKGLGQACSIGKVSIREEFKTKKQMREHLNNFSGWKGKEKELEETINEEWEIRNNIKRTGFPDPESKHHGHGELTDKITSEDSDPLFIEWVYVVKVKKHQMDILCSVMDAGTHKEKIGNGSTYNAPNYKHVLVTTIDLNGKEPNWEEIEKKRAKL